MIESPGWKAQSYTFPHMCSTCIIYVKICHKNNLGLRCELGLLRVDVPMSLPRRFFKIGTQSSDIAIIKKGTLFFKKNSEIETHFTSRAGRNLCWKGHPFTAKFWSVMTTSSGTPGTPTLHYFSNIDFWGQGQSVESENTHQNGKNFL